MTPVSLKLTSAVQRERSYVWTAQCYTMMAMNAYGDGRLSFPPASRIAALEALVSMSVPVAGSIANLAEFPWDCESDLIVLTPEDIRRVFALLGRGRVHYLLYNIDENRSLGYWELSAGLAYDF